MGAMGTGQDRIEIDMYMIAPYRGRKCTMYRLILAKLTNANLQRDLTVRIRPERARTGGKTALWASSVFFAFYLWQQKPRHVRLDNY